MSEEIKTTEINTTQAQAAPGWRGIALWVVKILLAFAFLGAGLAKLAGAQAMVQVYDVIGLGQWFRYVTGVVEVGGAILILIPSQAVFGALLLACTMVGAVITLLTVLPGSLIPALMLLALSAVVAWAHRDRLLGLQFGLGR